MRPHHPRASASRRRARILGIPRYLFFALLTVVVVALVVPLAIMFGRKKSSSPRSDVLIPLYVYPSPGAWDPLFTAITAHPTLNFTVVINPASGPGGPAGPDANYTREIPRLNSYANVRTVGYVSTNWTNRDIASALQDVETYSNWAENASIKDLGMHGIFLDETPSSWNNASAEFLRTITSAIQAASGFGSDPLIIHNPGTIPDPRYLSSCNLTVVFEGTYSAYQIYGFAKTISAFESSAKCAREAIACIIHDLPSTLTSKDEASLIANLKAIAGSIFLTGLATEYYSSFWDGWQGFVIDMDMK